MRSYHVELSTKAEKAINRLDEQVKVRISDWLQENLEGCENPRIKGIALKGKLAGKWRYRVGGYRIVAEIQDDKVIILIVDVDKRNDVYKKG